MASPATTALTSATSPPLGFSTLERETQIDSLPLSGELPQWLNGSLLRTGPAKFEIGEQRMRHWFDGLAMLHRFSISDDRVSYGNRYLHSRSYRAAQEQGRLVYGEFATDPCRSLFKRVQTLFSPGKALPDNANINVARLGERFISMTETPIPVQFDPHTLEAAGVAGYEVPGQLTTAHPHLERSSRGMLNYAAKLGRVSSYRFFHVPPEEGSKPRRIGSLPVKEPAYMHSFGLTERHFVLAEFPLVVNPLSLALAGRPYIENYKWKPELGTRFTLVDRVTGEATGGFQTDACFAFHHVNAYEEGEEVVVDLCVFEDAGVIEDLYLERLRAGKPIAEAKLTRFRLHRGTKAVTRELLCEHDIELPRINYGRFNERPPPLRVGCGQRRLERLALEDPQDRHRRRLHPCLVTGRLLRRRAGLRRSAGSRGGGRRCAALGRPRRRRRELVPAGARRERSQRAGPCERAPPHPIRIPRAVRRWRLTERGSQTAIAASTGHWSSLSRSG